MSTHSLLWLAIVSTVVQTQCKTSHLVNPSMNADSLSSNLAVSALETPSRYKKSLASSDSCSICWHAKPKESCSLIFLTDAGIYGVVAPSDMAGIRYVIDYGMLLNITECDAVGASISIEADPDYGLTLTPELRYRRWLDSEQSIDLGIGLPIFGETSVDYGVMSFYGLVKWNPVHWFGIALRPEIRRRGVNPYRFVPDYLKSSDPYRFSMSVGVEFGWIPGFSLTIIGGGVLALIVGAELSSI